MSISRLFHKWNRCAHRQTKINSSLHRSISLIVEAMERRVLLSASISGTMFNDYNGNGVRSANEPALAGWGCFIDLNNDGKFDGKDTRVFSDANGHYTFSGLAAGTYHIAQVPSAGWHHTQGGGNSLKVVLSPNQAATGQDFAVEQHGSISGVMFNDLNGDGIQQSNEPPLVGWGIFRDLNNNGQYDAGDIRVFSQSDGSFVFPNLLPGTYHLYQNTPTGWQRIQPAGFPFTVKLGTNQNVTGKVIANQQLGSATLASDGTLYVTGTNGPDNIHVHLQIEQHNSGPVAVTINGNTQNFTMFAGQRIVINALAGNDTVLADGPDQMASNIPPILTSIYGGAGNDNLQDHINNDIAGEGAANNDCLDGGSGDDNLLADSLDGNETLHGGDGNDTLASHGSTVHMFGDAGNDTLIFDGDVLEYMSGGTGTDTIQMNSAMVPGDKVEINLDGTAPAPGYVSNVVITPDIENLTGSWLGASLLVNGNALNNYISIDAGTNDITINGGAGNDTLMASDASDAQLNGGDGNDLLSVNYCGTAELSGGPGVDAVDYSKRTGNLSVYLDGSQPSTDSNIPSESDTFDGTVERVFGGSGNDLIVGTKGDNALFGNGGNDTLISNGGNDALWGGDGDDLFLAKDGSSTYVNGGNGNDTAYADAGDTLVSIEHVQTAPASLLPNGMLYVIGTNAADTIQVTAQTELVDNGLSTSASVVVNGATQNFSSGVNGIYIDALAGNDTVKLTIGNDVDSTSPYQVSLPATVLGGDGNDNLNAYLGAGPGIPADEPSLYMDGGDGNDVVSVHGDGASTLHGGNGDDYLYSEGFDTTTATMYGDAGNDSLFADLDTNPATLEGGDGNDNITVHDANQAVTVLGGAGTDTFNLSPLLYDQSGLSSVVFALDGASHAGSRVVLGADMENIVGTWAGPNLELIGNDSANVFNVQAETNLTKTLIGNGGNDTLYSNGGNDSLWGGDGNDTFYAKDGSPTYINGGNGTDTAYADLNDTLVSVEVVHH